MCKLCDKNCGSCDLEDCVQKIPPFAWWLIEQKRTPQSREQRRRYIARKRDLCIAFGICRECMCKDAKVGNYCTECYVKNAKHNERRRKGVHRAERISFGLCYFCGKPAQDGFKTCEKHHRIMADNLFGFDRTSANKNHVWRKMDRRVFKNVGRKEENEKREA